MNTNASDDAEPSVSSLKLIDVAYDGLTLLAEHESYALGSHWDGLKTRWAVAKKARSLTELLRDQLDLLPDTRARIARDHQLRRALLAGLQRDIRGAAKRAA